MYDLLFITREVNQHLSFVMDDKRMHVNNLIHIEENKEVIEKRRAFFYKDVNLFAFI